MIPERMCMVCRQMKTKDELVRIARHKDKGIFVDLTHKAGGRGAYVCKNGDCVKTAQKRKILERAFKQQINPELYDELNRICEEGGK